MQTSAPWILYVEGNDAHFQRTQQLLENRFHLIRATSDEEACDCVRASAEQIQIILVDLDLTDSRMGGLELSYAFRKKLPEAVLPDYARDLPPLSAPIVFVTGQGHPESLLALLAMGGNKILPKPVDYPRLTLAMTAFR